MNDHTDTLRSFRKSPRVHRRDCLKALAAAWVGAQAPAVWAGPLQAKAKQNIRLGVDGGVYSKFPVEEAASRIKDDGFHSILCSYNFADVHFDALAPDWKAAEKIAATFERRGITIAAAFGYANLVDPVAARRKSEETRIYTLVKNWKRLGCRNISTETGTFSDKSPWLDAPENFTEEGYRKCREALEKLAKVAEEAGAIVSLEAYWRNCIDSIERAERLFREVNSPALKLVMDPCNYYRKEDLPKMDAMLEEMFKRLGDRIVVAHAKDVKAAADGTDLPASGRGVLNYPLFLRLLAQLDRPMDLLLEHLTLDDVPRAREFVLAQFEKV
jgi:sugar phosphate isomerase/epimerase